MTAGTILVRGTNWIGDSVMSVAALRELRRLYPRDRIVLAARPWVAGLFQGQEFVDEILCLPEGRSRWDQIRFLRWRKQAFSRVLLFQNAFSAALVMAMAGIRHRIGYATDGRGLLLKEKAVPRIRERNLHQVYYYLDLLYQTRLSPTNYIEESDFRPDISLTTPPEGRLKARDLLKEAGVDSNRPLVALNPGAFFGSAKRWFTDRYARLAEQLIRSNGAEVVIIGSPGERQFAEQIAERCSESVGIMTGRTDLPTLMGLLEGSRLLVTNDSGPMHLAAALGVPQLALFGSTDEVATGPFSKKARVIHKHVACSPCLLRECPIDLRCFSSISVEEVTETAQSMLADDKE